MTIENHHVFTTTHELLVDDHHLVEKKQETLSHANGIEKTLVRTIDDKSYKVTETNFSGVPESRVETEMAEDEVKQFEEDCICLLSRGEAPREGDRQSSSSLYHETCAFKCQSLRLGNQVSTRDSITGP